jgi:hypothetical protein
MYHSLPQRNNYLQLTVHYGELQLESEEEEEQLVLCIHLLLIYARIT